MSVDYASHWTLDVERGPEWLFIRPHAPESGDSEGNEFAEQIWNCLEREFVHRVILEMDAVPFLRSHLIGQLVLLYKRIHAVGGTMRLAGLSDHNLEVLHCVRLQETLPHYRNREDAIMTDRPKAR